MNYIYDVGENITITDEYNMWLDGVLKENVKYANIINAIKEILEFSKKYNVKKSEVIEILEKVLNEI